MIWSQYMSYRLILFKTAKRLPSTKIFSCYAQLTIFIVAKIKTLNLRVSNLLQCII